MIVSAYCDGGIILKNPSTYGGTWAYCHVNEDDERIAGGSGYIFPHELDLPAVTNNITELLAAVRALSTLPDNWSGALCSDSQVTLRRMFAGVPPQNTPQWLIDEMKHQIGRVGHITPVLMNGHPTREHLLAGIGKSGAPVSRHQQWADFECSRLVLEYRARMNKSEELQLWLLEQKLQETSAPLTSERVKRGRLHRRLTLDIRLLLKRLDNIP